MRVLLWLAAVSGVVNVHVQAQQTVSNIDDLMALGQAVDNFGTGFRTTRHVFLSLQATDRQGERGSCVLTLGELGIEYYASFPEIYTAAIVDVDAADTSPELLTAVGVTRESVVSSCGQIAYVQRRSQAHQLSVQLYTPNPHAPDPSRAAADWLYLTQQCAVEVVNELDDKIEIIYSQGNDHDLPTRLNDMQPGAAEWLSTFATTTLTARYADNHEVIESYFVKGSGMFVIAPVNVSVDTCHEHGPREEVVWDDEDLRQRDHAEAERVNRNRVDPARLPKFTEVGFMKTKVPEHVWDMILTYYNDNKGDMKLEQWGKNNIYTNNEVAPTYMVTVPEAWAHGQAGKIKQAIWEGIRPILEEWTDNLQLTPTAMYGIRLYTNQSFLANHIDTRATHVISAIMNVDQEVTEDWPLEIYDHDGEAHQVMMRPGEMVLYESATCVHGRPTKFNGKYFANMFAHFKPMQPELWPY